METATPPCSACGLPFRESWPVLARNTRHDSGMITHLCPRCTLGRTGHGRRHLALTLQYKTRSHASHEHYAAREREDGVLEAPSANRDREVLTRRLTESLALIDRLRCSRLEQGQSDRPLRVLHVGCGHGDLLHQLHLQSPTPLVLAGIEPCEIWAAQAQKRGFSVSTTPLEERSASADSCFDVIIEHHVLEHLDDPRRHLKAMRQHLVSDGVVLLEVPNVARASGQLDREFLQVSHPNVFTPRALATLCSHAGLLPLTVSAEEDLLIACRPSLPHEKKVVFPGAQAQEVIMAAIANDLRLSLKRGFWRAGVTPRTLELAQRVHQECKWAAGRADLALEVAIACEREDKLEQAEHWLKTSLEDRKDSEVACILVRVQTILRHRAANRPPSPTPVLRSPNYAFREQPLASLRN